MATLVQDGFDLYAVANDLNMKYVSSANVVTNGGRWGGGCVDFNSNAGASILVASLPTQPTTIYQGFSMFVNTSNVGGGAVAQWASINGGELSLEYDVGTFNFKLYKTLDTGSADLIATSPNVPISPFEWNWIDIELTLSPGAGLFKLWVNNVLYMTYNGQTAWQPTMPQQTQIVSAALGAGFSRAGTLTMRIDDLQIRDTLGTLNNTRIGDSRIYTTEVNADVTPNNGTPSTSGAHYLMLNEAQWSASNYVTLNNTAGQAEQFSIAPIAGTPAYVFSVQVVAVCQKSDGGLADAEVYIVSSGNEADGPNTPVKTTFFTNYAIFDSDPNTSAAWTYGAVNALDIGYKVAA